MYQNIGKKIKGFAKTQAIIGTIISIFIGLIFVLSGIAQLDNLLTENLGYILIAVGVMIAIFGSVLSHIATWILYGYGELIDKVMNIDERLNQISQVSFRTNPTPKYDSQPQHNPGHQSAPPLQKQDHQSAIQQKDDITT